MLKAILMLCTLLALSACGRSADPQSSARSGKMEGSDVKKLTHAELMAVLHECHQYGSSDDPRVKYSTSYCSAAQSAHSMEGYTTPSSAAVDPTLTKMH
jgi:hypothetical protein